VGDVSDLALGCCEDVCYDEHLIGISQESLKLGAVLEFSEELQEAGCLLHLLVAPCNNSIHLLRSFLHTDVK